TLDAAAATVTDWSLTGPLGTFNKADSFSNVATWTPASSPSADFVGLSFVDVGGNFLWLRFETTLGAFDGSTFYTGTITVPGGGPRGPTYPCRGGAPPPPACNSTSPGLSPFSTGSARPEAPAAVPEPASMLLLGTGLASMGARRWRNRRQRS